MVQEITPQRLGFLVSCTRARTFPAKILCRTGKEKVLLSALLFLAPLPRWPSTLSGVPLEGDTAAALGEPRYAETLIQGK